MDGIVVVVYLLKGGLSWSHAMPREAAERRVQHWLDNNAKMENPTIASDEDTDKWIEKQGELMRWFAHGTYGIACADGEKVHTIGAIKVSEIVGIYLSTRFDPPITPPPPIVEGDEWKHGKTQEEEDL